MDALLHLDAIGKSFPGVRALDGVSLTVAPGEVHALVGENGAGKSTLIKIVSGAYTPSVGAMTFAGQPFRPRHPADAIAAGVATIDQDRNLLPDRPVLFNLALGRERGRFRLDRSAMRADAARVLALLGASDTPLDLPAGRLPAGRKQLVEIGRALLCDSRLLIMDEPTSALNREEQEALFRVVKDLRGRGLSILYISHRLDEIFRLADRVSVLRDGRHVLTSPASELDPDRLIAAMVGRSFTGAFPERAPASDETALTVSDLCGRGFRDVSFALKRGEVLGITGLAGSGKEELGRALYGAARPTAGRATLGGAANGASLRFTPADSIAAGLAFIPEERKVEGVIGALPVRRNISLPLIRRLSRFGHVRRVAERTLAQEWVDRLGIKTPGLEQEVQYLSGGNQQKVALARGLAPRAQVVILSHPTQEIDVGVKFELYGLVGGLARQGQAVILISSDLPELIGLCHRVLVMRDGGVVAELPGGSDAETILRHSLGSGESKKVKS